MRRNDAKMVYDIPTYNKIFPFMMKRRCDALVYHSFELDVTKTIEFVRKYNMENPEHSIRFFYVFCAALMRTFALRPELNRFISRSRYWQRNELSMNFIVKESLSDSSPETSSPLVFRPDMTLPEYAEIIDKYIESARKTASEKTYTDHMIDFITRLPVWMVSAIIRFLGILDLFGCAPDFLKKADGLHTSVFVSNLGSIGLTGSSPHHHLYEWGTTSIFLTMGRVERRRQFNDKGQIVSTRDVISICVTIDERITSGFYLVNSMFLLRHLLLHPEELMERPELPPPVLTRKEYRENRRKDKK